MFTDNIQQAQQQITQDGDEAAAMEHGDRILARESEHYGGRALQTGVEKLGER